jgi:hypothetical protein
MRAVLIPNRSVPPAEGARELADATLESLADLDPQDVLLDASLDAANSPARRGNEPTSSDGPRT